MSSHRLIARTFLILLLLASALHGPAVLAQGVIEPGQPGYMTEKVEQLLTSPPLDSNPDQMYFLLLFLWADSLVRAGTLITDDSLEADTQLQSQLIAETGVWESAYRAASSMPAISNPTLAPMQSDVTEAMKLSVDAGADLRDYVMTGNDGSLYRAIPKIEQMSNLLSPWMDIFGMDGG